MQSSNPDIYSQAPPTLIPRHITHQIYHGNSNSNVSHQNPLKPAIIYQSLTGSHGPMHSHSTNSLNFNFGSQTATGSNTISSNYDFTSQFEMQVQRENKENSSIAANQVHNLPRKSGPCSSKSCITANNNLVSSHGPMGTKSSLLKSHGVCSEGALSKQSTTSNRSNSNAFKGDRFIPFRGSQDNFYFEEYIICNDPFKELKKQRAKIAEETQSHSHNNQSDVNQLPSANNNPDQSVYSTDSSNSSSNNIQYSRGSGQKKRQNYQEFMTECFFSDHQRASPSKMSMRDLEDGEGLRCPKITSENMNARQSQSRILSYREKKSLPSKSLSKNLSLINTIALEKSKSQQKSLRHIPQFPEKILDAPDLVDDYYLNLLDWSQNNILAVCLAQTVYLWNAESGEIKQLFDTENDADIVTSVAWMKGAQGQILAIGTSSCQTHLWDTNQFERIRTFNGQHSQRVSSLSWNPRDQFLLSSGSLDSAIHNNDIRIPLNQSVVSTFQAHRQEVCGLKWSLDGQQLASGGNDNLLCIWDINNRMRHYQPSQYIGQSNIYGPRFCFTQHNAAVKALAWSPHQRGLLASGGGSRDQTIKFWNTETGELVKSVQTDSQVCALQWNPNEKEILSSHGFINNQLSIWKYPTMKKIADLRGHTSRVLHLALSPDGTTVASAAADETLRFWKVFQPIPASSTSSKLQNGLLNGCGNADVIMTDASKYLQSQSIFGNGLSLR